MLRQETRQMRDDVQARESRGVFRSYSSASANFSTAATTKLSSSRASSGTCRISPAADEGLVRLDTAAQATGGVLVQPVAGFCDMVLPVTWCSRPTLRTPGRGLEQPVHQVRLRQRLPCCSRKKAIIWFNCPATQSPVCGAGGSSGARSASMPHRADPRAVIWGFGRGSKLQSSGKPLVAAMGELAIEQDRAAARGRRALEAPHLKANSTTTGKSIVREENGRTRFAAGGRSPSGRSHRR
jgi:hypothetical protein